MKHTVFLVILHVVLVSVVMGGCEKAPDTPAPQQSVVASPPPPQAPPQPQPLSLFMVPLNPAEFSMQAIQANKKKIETQPDDVEALVGLADANLMISRFDVARDYYERALKVDQGHVNANLSLSNCYVFLQRPDDAISQLDQLLNTSNDQPEALFNKGLILLKSKQDTEGARASWSALIEKHPTHQLAQRVRMEIERL